MLKEYTCIIGLGWSSLSFLIALLATPLCMRLARYIRMMDYPDGRLKTHDQATPYLGGLALCISLFIPLMRLEPKLLLGLSILFFFGMLDDKFRLSPSVLFISHSLGALVLLSSGFVATIFPWSVANYFLSYLWLVCLINGFNLIDVMDGLAITSAICSSVAFICFSILLQHENLFYLSSALLGALLGFFVYNRPKAQIYLGDAGSLFLGGLFASLALRVNWDNSNAAHFFIAPILVAAPLLELVGLILIRTYKGIPFYKGSADHFSHYLLASGLTKKQILKVVFSLYCLLIPLAVSWYLDIIHSAAFFTVAIVIVGLWYTNLFRNH